MSREPHSELEICRAADDRKAVFDIAVRTLSGEEYIIEMQLASRLISVTGHCFMRATR